MIDRAARDPNVKIDKMQRLLEMRDRELDRIARIEFAKAMRDAQAEMKPIARDADNDQTKSKYARYETISEAVQPIVTKYDFSLTFSEGTPDKENHIRVICYVMHVGGYFKQYYADVPFDNVGLRGNASKTNTHAYGSTKSYGRRYLKLDIFDIAVKNDDKDGNADKLGEDPALDQPISKEQIEQLTKAIARAGGNVARFCAFGEVASLDQIKVRQFDAAMDVARQRAQYHR